MARSTYRWAQKGQGLIAGLTKGNQWLINLMRPEYPHFRGGGGRLTSHNHKLNVGVGYVFLMGHAL